MRSRWLTAAMTLAFVVASADCDRGATPAAHRFAMLALGDSYTIGETVAPAERWPNVLAARLRGDGVDVGDPLIIARTGWTTADLNRAIDEAALRDRTFDLVTLLIGVNDQFRGAPPEPFRPRFVAIVRRAIALAHGEATHVVVVSIPDWSVMPFAAEYDRARVAASLAAYNVIAAEESRRAGVGYVDVTPISQTATGDDTLIAADGLHPSATQYVRWVEQIAPCAERVLAPAPTTRP